VCSSVREQSKTGVRYEGTNAACRYEASSHFGGLIPSLYELNKRDADPT
jgi:hypothetical protein